MLVRFENCSVMSSRSQEKSSFETKGADQDSNQVCVRFSLLFLYSEDAKLLASAISKISIGASSDTMGQVSRISKILPGAADH